MNNQVEKKQSFQESLTKIDKNKKKSLRNRLIFVAVLFTVVASYFFLPLSRVTMRVIIGNTYYTEDEILKIAQIGGYQSLYNIDTTKAKNNLIAHPLFEDNSVSVKVSPLGLKITAEEIVPAIKLNDKYYGSDSKIIDESLINNEDILIGEHLKNNLIRAIKLINYEEKEENKVTFTRICKDVRNFDNYSKENIKYISISADTIDFYLDCSNYSTQILIKVSVNRSQDYFSDNEIIQMCSHNHLNGIYENAIGKIKSTTMKYKEETIEENNYNVYCFKAIRTINESGVTTYAFIPIEDPTEVTYGK